MRPLNLWLIPLDLACLAVFVLLGLQTHGELAQSSALQRFVINFGSLGAAWVVAGLALGVFRWASPVSLRALLSRTLITWLVAAPLGIVLRALVLGSPIIAVPFFLVTLGLGGAALLVGRLAFVLLAVRRAIPG